MPSVTHQSRKVIPDSNALQLFIDGEVSSHPISRLCDVEYRKSLDDQIERSKKTVKVNLSGLTSWDDEHRLSTLIFLVEHEDNVEFYLGKKPVGSKLLEAVLKINYDINDLQLFQVIKVTLLAIIGLLYPRATERAVGIVLAGFQKRGITGYDRRQLISEAKSVCKEVNEYLDAGEGTDEPRQLAESLPAGLSIAIDLLVPREWSISEAGIAREGKDPRIRTPVWISDRHVDLQRGKVWVTVCWLADGKIEREVVTRDVIATKRQIVTELSVRGCPVHDNNAQQLIEFLSDFESANQSALRTSVVTTQLGWQLVDEGPSFMLGHQHLTRRLNENGESDNRHITPISFQGGDTGDRQIADAFRPSGSLDGWKKMLRTLRHYPQVMLCVYASMAAPMLRLFDSPNFFVSIAGRTSSGKTTLLRVLASIWGNPNEQDAASVLKTWRGTPVSRERTCAVLNNLPLILDDTKLANPTEVGPTVFNVVDGVGRARGSVAGMAAQATWTTVGITSGEQPVTEFTQDGGTRARVLALWGLPFGDQNSKSGKLVLRLNQHVRRHYGHAGRELIQYTLDNWDELPNWKDRYQARHATFIRLAAESRNPFAGRLAAHFAAISTTAWIAHQAFKLPWGFTEPVEPLWDTLAQNAGEANRAAEALRYTMDWAVANQSDFFGRNSSSGSQPTRGWAGRWNDTAFRPGQPEDEANWEWIGFIPSVLRNLLKEGGFEAEAIIRTWKDDGWLVTSEASRNTLRTRIGREKDPTHVIAIRKSAVDEVRR